MKMLMFYGFKKKLTKPKIAMYDILDVKKNFDKFSVEQ